jgi:hypothetical protein
MLTVIAKTGSIAYLVTVMKRANSAPLAPHGAAVTLTMEYPEDFVTCEDFLR